MKKRITLSVIFLLYVFVAKSQNVLYSNPYTSKLQINPAFAGVSKDLVLSSSYRIQNPNLIDATFTTLNFTADLYLPHQNSGVGVNVFSDNQGEFLQFTGISATYSYHVSITDELKLSFALQPTLAFVNVNTQGLIFGDQLENLNSISIDPLAVNYNWNTFLVNSGLVVYGEGGWFGASIYNASDKSSNLHKSQISAQIGKHFSVSEDIRLSHFLVYNHQIGSYSKQLYLGNFVAYKSLSAGISYRGLLISKYKSDALITSFSINLLENLKLNYSYDISLNKVYIAGGAHELLLSFNTPIEFKKKKKLVKCSFPI